MDVYIKPVKKALITGRKVVLLKDIAEIFSPDGSSDEIKNIIVYKISADKKDSYLITILDILKAVNITIPKANVINLGEMDVLVEYSPVNKQAGKLFTYIKILCVIIVLFFGASTAIMSFHSDAQLPNILDNYYYIFFGERSLKPYILSIPYSLGLTVGIIVFFNHFSKIHITQDPTPIEVQMSTYETETIASVVDYLGNKNVKKEKSSK